MSSVDNIERKYLFRLTRFVALFFIVIAIIPIILGGAHFLQSFFPESVAISESEISEIVKPKTHPSDNEETGRSESYTDFNKIGDPLSGLKIPFPVQKYFSTTKNMDALRNWLEPMNHSERGQFLKELEIVVQKAEAEKLDVAQTINHFWEVKNVRLTYRNGAESAQSARNYIYAGMIGAAIITIAMFSLVLVLLAIERNTRK